MLKVVAAIAALLAFFAAGAYFLGGRQAAATSVIVSGNIETTDAEVSFKLPGRVESRLVDEGERITEGKVVARLDSSDLAVEVAVRRAELAQAEAALRELEAGSRPEEIAAAEAAMQRAQWALEVLRAGSREQEIKAAEAAMSAAVVERERLLSELERARQLQQRNAIPPEQFDRARAAYEVALQKVNEVAEQFDLVKAGPRQQQIKEAEAALGQARAQYELVKKGPRQEAIDQSRALLDKARAAVRLAEIRLGYATLVSPLTGMVIAKHIEPGEYVSQGTPIITVGDLEHVWLRAYINETDLGRVKPGQRARVTTDAYPDKAYEGRVSFVSSEAEFTPKSVQTDRERVKLVFRIKIDVPNPATELLPGMPADAAIEVAP